MTVTHQESRVEQVQHDSVSQQINRRRFSQGPYREGELRSWKSIRTWDVYRELTNHEVVVVRKDVDRWDILHYIAFGVSALILLAALFQGMPLVYAVVLGVAAGLVTVGLLRFERSLAGTDISSEMVVTMDAPVWEVVSRNLTTMLNNKKDTYNLWGNSEKLLSEKSLSVQTSRLRSLYEDQLSLASDLGTGVSHCGCQACAACREHDITPPESGVAVAGRLSGERRPLTPIVSTRASRRADRLYERKRQRQQARERRQREIQDKQEQKRLRKREARLRKDRLKKIRQGHSADDFFPEEK